MNKAQAWRRAGLQLTAWSVIILVALWPTVAHITGVWSSSDSFRYSWLIFPTLTYLCFDPWRNRIFALTPRASLWGFALAVPALALWLGGHLSGINALEHLALILLILSGFLFFAGPALFRQVLPLLGFPLLLFPNSDIMMPLLQPLTLFWVKSYAVLLQLPLEVDGFRISVDGLRYIVNEACAGLPTFNLFLFLGFSFGLILYRDLPRVLATTAGFAVLAIMANAVRVVTIVAIDRGRSTQMNLADHEDIQFVIVAAALLLLVLIVATLPRKTLAHG